MPVDSELDGIQAAELVLGCGKSIVHLAFLFSRSIGPNELGGGQMELAAGIGWQTESQAGLLLKSDLDAELDLMRAPFR